MEADSRYRPVWAEIDLDAVRANVRTLAGVASPAALMAVVKADGYGHGAVPVARAALEAGAQWLGVALVEEGAELRAAGIDAPVLVLSEPPPPAAPAVVALGLTPVAYTPPGIDALAKAVADSGAEPLPVHLKVDTGMHRVGCAVADAGRLAESITTRDELRLEGVLTHLAVADEPGNPYTPQQLDRFEAVLDDLRRAGVGFDLVHAANSAALLEDADRARFDLVRCGIAVYGVPPAPDLAGRVPLRPAMAVKARVSHVKRLRSGDRLSYGLRYAMPADGTVVTVPERSQAGPGDVTINVSPDMLRKQLTIIGSWTFSAMGQADCARFIVDNEIKLERIFSHRWKLDQASEAYRVFDTQSTGKGVITL